MTQPQLFASNLENSHSAYQPVKRWSDSTRGQLILLGGFIGVVLLSRVLFVSKILYHWDSVNFAYALGEFNLAKEQPQPPGYIVYVWLCQILNALFHDAQTVMVVISIGSCLGAVLAMFSLGKALYNQRVAWAGAIFLAASPLFWFYNEIALPHTLDAFLVIWIMLLLFRISQGEHRLVLPAVVLLAVAGGVRQQTLVFLGPVVVFALRKIGWKAFVVAGAVGLGVCLAWFVPLIGLSGGLGQYLQVMNDFSARFQTTTSLLMGAGWWGLARNLTKLGLYTGYGWGLFAIPLVIFVFRTLPKLRQVRLDSKTVLLVLWVLPALAYYMFVHMGQQGLVFVFLPALILAGAAALDELCLARRPLFFWGSVCALAFISVGIFLFLPEYPFGADRQRFLTRQTIEHSDEYFLDRFGIIRELFPSDQTIIVAANWHHVQFYLPDYKVVQFSLGSKWEIDEGAAVNPTGIFLKGTAKELGLKSGAVRVVLFDPELADFTLSDNLIEPISLEHGGRLEFVGMDEKNIFFLQPDSFGVIQ